MLRNPSFSRPSPHAFGVGWKCFIRTTMSPSFASVSGSLSITILLSGRRVGSGLCVVAQFVRQPVAYALVFRAAGRVVVVRLRHARVVRLKHFHGMALVGAVDALHQALAGKLAFPPPVR